MITKINVFLNEGLRDKMVSKSDEDVKKAYAKIDELEYDTEKLGYIYKYDLFDHISEDDLNDLKDKAAEETLGLIQKDFDNNEYGLLITYVIMVEDHGEIIKELIDDGTIDIVELLYLFADVSKFMGSDKYFGRIKPKIFEKIFEILKRNKHKLPDIIAEMSGDLL